MRPSWFRDLAVVVLAVAVSRSPALAGRVLPKPVHRPDATVKTFTEEGYGVNEELARKHALGKLYSDVADWLATEHPEITYTPTQGEIDAMVREFTPPEAWTPPKKADARDADKEDLADDKQTAKKKELLEEQHMVVVRLTAELTNNDLAAFQAETRSQLSQHRQAILARGLGGAFALVAVGTGYLRLEEKMGRHKRKLGVAAIGLLGLVGLALLAFGFDYF
jgi:hypothetical protein